MLYEVIQLVSRKFPSANFSKSYNSKASLHNATTGACTGASWWRLATLHKVAIASTARYPFARHRALALHDRDDMTLEVVVCTGVRLGLGGLFVGQKCF